MRRSWHQLRKSRRGVVTLIAFAASVVATAVLAWASWGAGAINANIRVDPSTQYVLPGDTFTINMVNNADVALGGVEADLSFDPSRFEVLDVGEGPNATDWKGASFLLGVAPQGEAEAIAEANMTGSLLNIARFISVGTQPIPAGPRVFAVITMRAKPGAPLGTSALTLSGLDALDAGFNGVPTSKTDGEVVLTDVLPTATIAPPSPTVTDTPTQSSTPTITSTSPPATSTHTPGASTATPTGSPTIEPTETPGSGEPGILRIDPQMQSVADGASVNLAIVQFVEIQMFGVQSDVTFDPGLLQLTSFAGGSGYPAGLVDVGTAGQSDADAIAEANITGTLKNLQIFQSESAISSGENEAFRLVFQARPGASGVSAIGLKNVFFYGIDSVSVTRIGGLVEVIGPPTATSTATLEPSPSHTAMPSATQTFPAPTATQTVEPTATGTVAPTATSTKTAVPSPTSPAATATATPVTPSPTIPATATTAALATSTITALPSLTPTTPQPTGTTPAGGTATAPPSATASATTAAGTATASATTASGSPSPSPTVDPATADSTISITPPTITAPPGAEFTVILVQQAGFETTGAEADIKFDPALLQVVRVEKSQAYSKASLLAGVAPQNVDQAIAEANTDGRLKNVATFFVPGSGSIPAGQAEFVRVVFKVSPTASDTATALSLLDLEMLDSEGEPVIVAGKDGQLTIQAGAAVPTPPGAGSTVAGASAAPTRLPSAGVNEAFGELNWALTISLIAMLASGGALVGSLYRKQS